MIEFLRMARGADSISLDWQRLPDLPNELGVAGPFVGVHNGALIVAGGANFARPVWESDKRWHDTIHVLTSRATITCGPTAGRCREAIGYGAAVSTRDGVLCIGGNDAEQTFRDVFLLSWDPRPADHTHRLSALAAAVRLRPSGAGGQHGLSGRRSKRPSLDTAMKNFWALDLSKKDQPDAFVWQELDAWPGQSRAFNLTVHQHNGYNDCVYVMSGRRQEGDGIQFLTDVWEFTPRTGVWRRRAEMPRPAVAGTGIGYGQSHILVLGGDDGALFFKTDELRDQHPGFPRTALAYHTITDTWTPAGDAREPGHHHPVMWDGPDRDRQRRTAAARPIGLGLERQADGAAARFRSRQLRRAVQLSGRDGRIGVYFANKNKRHGRLFPRRHADPLVGRRLQHLRHHAQLADLHRLPSKAFAQDWVYAVGNMMIPVVAFVGVFVALPFYRRLNVTSAYEYLELRFSRPVRLFGSASFTLFHIFRMAVVMSLTGLALAVATPLTPAQSVLLMGVLSIIYCTMGGIEAVIWTDTIQTFVLMGGALLALTMLMLGPRADGRLVSMAWEADKFRIANFHWDVTSAQIALWVIVIGGIGQNISSYTADQAVVQRYMTTPDQRRAARSIWTNAIMTIPATLLFFGMGTALFAFYRTHPGTARSDDHHRPDLPAVHRQRDADRAGRADRRRDLLGRSIDRFDQHEFDRHDDRDRLLRPFNACRTEDGYLRCAGHHVPDGRRRDAAGLVFVDPEIKSLFDAFLMIIGLFMGVLGGLFVLGVMTRRANAFGAMTGAVVGAAVMISIWRFTQMNGYLYTATGIATCFVVGYLASLLRGGTGRDLTGLTSRSPLPKIS
jgi:solute:Na+ symporter, SSS family